MESCQVHRGGVRRRFGSVRCSSYWSSSVSMSRSGRRSLRRPVVRTRRCVPMITSWFDRRARPRRRATPTSRSHSPDATHEPLAETMIGLHKAELIRHRRPWRGLEDVEFATLEWVDWFDHRRLFEAHGQIPPAEYEEIHYRQQEAQASRPRLKPNSLHKTRSGSHGPSGFSRAQAGEVQVRTHSTTVV